MGPMSREMKPEESQVFEKKYGYKPTQVRVCLDATDSDAPRCHAEVMTSAQAWSPAPAFAGLVAALEGLPRERPDVVLMDTLISLAITLLMVVLPRPGGP